MQASAAARNAAHIGSGASSCYSGKMSWRIKSEIFIQALVRRVYAAQSAAYIVRRGDSDAGNVMIRINQLDGYSGVLTMFTDMSGERCWRVAQALTALDRDVDDFLTREINRDPDVWVVEIEDKQGRHFLEERIDGKWDMVIISE